MKIMKVHQRPLKRQVHEAVLIENAKVDVVMNSKAEFSRCYIPRLVVEVEDQDAKKDRLTREKEYEDETRRILNNEDLSWEEQKTKAQELAAKKRIRDGGRDEDGACKDGAPRKKARRMEFKLLEDDWGGENGDKEEDDYDGVWDEF